MTRIVPWVNAGSRSSLGSIGAAAFKHSPAFGAARRRKRASNAVSQLSEPLRFDAVRCLNACEMGSRTAGVLPEPKVL